MKTTAIIDSSLRDDELNYNLVKDADDIKLKIVKHEVEKTGKGKDSNNGDNDGDCSTTCGGSDGTRDFNNKFLSKSKSFNQRKDFAKKRREEEEKFVHEAVEKSIHQAKISSSYDNDDNENFIDALSDYENDLFMKHLTRFDDNKSATSSKRNSSIFDEEKYIQNILENEIKKYEDDNNNNNNELTEYEKEILAKYMNQLSNSTSENASSCSGRSSRNATTLINRNESEDNSFSTAVLDTISSEDDNHIKRIENIERFTGVINNNNHHNNNSTGSSIRSSEDDSFLNCTNISNNSNNEELLRRGLLIQQNTLDDIEDSNSFESDFVEISSSISNRNATATTTTIATSRCNYYGANEPDFPNRRGHYSSELYSSVNDTNNDDDDDNDENERGFLMRRRNQRKLRRNISVWVGVASCVWGLLLYFVRSYL